MNSSEDARGPASAALTVMKFGGGCLRDAASFADVCQIVLASTDPTVVVVSAVSGVTDAIIAGLDRAIADEREVPVLRDELAHQHRGIAAGAIDDGRVREETLRAIEAKLQRLERLLYGASYTGEITPHLRALVASFGERLSAELLAGAIRSRGGDAHALDADALGLVTDDSPENATADIPATAAHLEASIRPLLAQGAIPVVTGFFGRSPSGKTTTFGRNGSDYSAAVIAAALQAHRLEIWKDVDGFMSADPKSVGTACLIEHLSYDEAAELSYFGARVLHPRTVEPIAPCGIPVFIRSVADRAGAGTRIVATGFERDGVIKGVTCNRRIGVLRVHGPGVGCKPGIIARIGELLAGAGINIYSVITAQTCINLIVDQSDAARGRDVLLPLAGGVIDAVLMEEDKALVAVVGEGLHERKGVAARVFSAVAGAGVNVEMISSGASAVAYYFVVGEGEADRAIAAVHGEFFPDAAAGTTPSSGPGTIVNAASSVFDSAPGVLIQSRIRNESK